MPMLCAIDNQKRCFVPISRVAGAALLHIVDFLSGKKISSRFGYEVGMAIHRDMTTGRCPKGFGECRGEVCNVWALLLLRGK